MSTPRHTFRTLAVATALASSAALVACGSQGPEVSGNHSGPSSSSSSSTAVTPGQTASEEQLGKAHPGEGKPAPLPEGACATADLRITSGPIRGAAGSQLVELSFTNTSAEECTLKGFPGVSLVTGGDGTQLGKPAERETQMEPQPVPLQPQQTARTSLKLTNPGVLPEDKCQPATADGLRVYPPNETKSAFVRLPGLRGCAGEISQMSVQPITPLQPQAAQPEQIQQR